MRPTTASCVALVALLALAGAAEAHATNRKLLQSWGPGGYPSNRNTNLGANTVRSQAATSQAIENAVNSGASMGATRNAGVTGAVTSWATNQDQSTFDFVDRISGPYGIAGGVPFGRRRA